MAAAIFGDASKVDYVDINAATRFLLLANDQYDILARGASHEMDRDIFEVSETIGNDVIIDIDGI